MNKVCLLVISIENLDFILAIWKNEDGFLFFNFVVKKKVNVASTRLEIFCALLCYIIMTYVLKVIIFKIMRIYDNT